VFSRFLEKSKPVRGGVKVAENWRFEIPFSCSKKAPHGR
jgi:hypothetical protein